MSRTWQVVAPGLGFIEGPRWHDGALWLSDIADKAVLRVTPDGRVEEVARFEDEPSGLGFTPEGDLVVALMKTQSILRRTDEAFETIARLGSLAEGRCNDMITDGCGRSYVGVCALDPETMETRADAPMVLLRVDPDGRSEVAARDVHFPNGVAVTEDGGTLVLAETMAHRLTAFDVDVDSGALSNRRVFAALGDGVYPDGLCLDGEGCVWVANPVGQEVLRVAAGGEVVERLPTPGPVLACTTGGHERRELFALVVPALDIAACRARREAAVLTTPIDVPGAGRP